MSESKEDEKLLGFLMVVFAVLLAGFAYLRMYAIAGIFGVMAILALFVWLYQKMGEEEAVRAMARIFGAIIVISLLVYAIGRYNAYIATLSGMIVSIALAILLARYYPKKREEKMKEESEARRKVKEQIRIEIRRPFLGGLLVVMVVMTVIAFYLAEYRMSWDGAKIYLASAIASLGVAIFLARDYLIEKRIGLKEFTKDEPRIKAGILAFWRKLLWVPVVIEVVLAVLYAYTGKYYFVGLMSVAFLLTFAEMLILSGYLQPGKWKERMLKAAAFVLLLMAIVGFFTLVGWLPPFEKQAPKSETIPPESNVGTEDFPLYIYCDSDVASAILATRPDTGIITGVYVGTPVTYQKAKLMSLRRYIASPKFKEGDWIEVLPRSGRVEDIRWMNIDNPDGTEIPRLINTTRGTSLIVVRNEREVFSAYLEKDIECKEEHI